jgi:NADH-ubiquinone oxidoreductase chain 2
MIFISILILIVAIALPSFNKQVSPILFTRISSIIFIYAGALSFNALYIQSIGSGIGIYSGLFHVTIISQFLEVFLLIIGSLILISWPINNSISNSTYEPMAEAVGCASKRPHPIINEGIVNTTNLSLIYPLSSLQNIIKINYATEYSLVVLFSTLGASLLVSSCDLISMYLSIELQSFGVYILATLYRNSESATSAGLKYFLLGGLSSCIILLGASLIYTYTGLTNFESIYSLISVSYNYNNDIILGLSLGLILIIIGFLFKIAAAPLHNWAPDVYDDSPTIVTIWLTIMPKISILILLLEAFGQTQSGLLGNISYHSLQLNLIELYNESLSNINLYSVEGITIMIGSEAENTIPSSLYSILPPFGNGWKEGMDGVYVLKILLLISSLLSLIIGTVVGLAQTRIKRLLAYSTISHIGFILLALVINTAQSIDSFIFYIIQYSLTNLNTFLIIIALGYIIQQSIFNNYAPHAPHAPHAPQGGLKNNSRETLSDIKYISELKGQFFSNPILSLSLSVCLFSMAGIPPLIGFFAKQFVLYSAIQNGYYFISIVAILVSVISASYYLKIIKVLHTNPMTTLVAPLLKEEATEYKEENISEYSDNLLNKHKKEEVKVLNNKSYLSNQLLSHFHSFSISTLTLTIILFVLKPSIILNSTQLLSLSLYNF